VKLELRHLSGSRAGETESFDHTTEITVGRHPSSLVLFDPDRDRSVSGHHASITFDGVRWMLRDLGSSNGTFVGEQRVREHELRTGETIQFGAQGPKVRVTFADEALNPLGAAAAPVEGRTVMMMMDHDAAPAPAGASAALKPRKKKGGMGRALLIVGTVGVLLLIGLAALALVVRNNNIKKKRQARANQTTTAAATTTEATASTPTETTGSETTTEAVALQQQIAETKETLESAQESIQKGDQSASEIADLKRQIAESQALMEQMTRQLQEKNDEVAAERARAAAQPKVVYVPVPAPAPLAAPQSEPAREPAQPVSSQPVSSQPAYSQPAPESSQPASPRPAVTQTPVRPAPVTPTAAPRPAPVVVTETVAPPPVRTTRAAPPVQKPTAPAPASVPAPLPPPPSPLYNTKALKMKVSISSVPPEIPPANLPAGTEKGLVNLIGAALVSSGDYVVGSNGQANVSVMVTNYKADSNRNVNTAGAASSAKKIGKLFGQKLPGNPVDVKNVSYDAAMSARVRILDRAGRILLETEPSSASADRKSKVAIAGVSFNDTALSDTAVGDVARKVVADAVDALRVNLAGMEWMTQVGGSTKDKLTLAVGSSAFVEPGDIFEVLDAQQRVVARARVASVTETASEAMLITDPGKQRLAGLTARYIGNESPTATRRSARTITTRAKTPVFSGPGTSFNQLKELKPGVRMSLHFTVGAWAKADDGSGPVWVPLANATIGS